MAFACVYIPEFSVQAVMRFEPALRGCPLALLEGMPPQCRVVAANEAALRAGIEIGMAKAQAEQFGSVVQIRRRSREQEKNAHAALLDLGASFSPRVEDTAPEAGLLDLAGLEYLFGNHENIAQRLAQGARDLGLEARVAVASNPDTTLHAARGFSDIAVIPAGEEAARLGPLPISVLGPSLEALETLHRWGVRTCAALAALPVLDLSERLGPEGVRLHEGARGAVQRSLMLAEPPLSFKEELTLDYEVTELEPLSFLLSRLIEALCARLQVRSLAVGALRLRLKLAQPPSVQSAEKGEILRRPHKSRPLQGDRAAKAGESRWFNKVLSLPVPMRNTKLLLNLLRLQLQSNPPGAPVCGVFLAAEPARPRATQSRFFVPKGPDPEKLELTLARLAHLVGESRVGSPEIADTHRPDAFRMRRFAPGAAGNPKPAIKAQSKAEKPQGPRQSTSGHPELQQKPSRSDNCEEIVQEKPQVARKPGRPKPRFMGSGEPHRSPETGLQKTILAPQLENRITSFVGFRTFRPAVQARVEMHAGRPVKVFFRGLRGDVIAASGPWRASGDWWTKDAWQHEEWDLEIAFTDRMKALESKTFTPRWPSLEQHDFGNSDSAQPRAAMPHKNPDSTVLRQIGLYRFAYDPARDIWMVRGMFD